MKISKIIYASFILMAFAACNEKKILEEVPLDFLTAENSYVTPEGINSAITMLYDRASAYICPSSSSGGDAQFWFGTDVCYHARYYSQDRWTVYNVNPDDSKARDDWRDAYKIIFGSNVVLGRATAGAEDPIKYNDEGLRNEHLGEAAFFRAWSYRNLVHLFGDVPIVLEEVTEAKRDYTRNPKSEVYDQIIKDFIFARDNLPKIDDVRDVGRLPNAAASYYLAEIYVTVGRYDDAIAELNSIINSGEYALMTERFGSRKDEPGDVFWDLFRLNNQNRSSGNTEVIWAFQDEYPTQGGDNDARWERTLGGEYNRWQAKDEYDGIRTFIYESTYNGGRGQGYIRPTSHVTHGIWKDNFYTDIRNSEYNIKRKWWVDNPQSAYYGDTIDLSDPADMAKYMGGPRGVEDDTNRYMYPYYHKFVTVNNHVAEELLDGSLTDAQKALATPEHIAMVESYGGVGPKLHGNARRYRTEIYALRLAEVYLLRAEAYLMKGDQASAATDINVVRDRANATPVLAADVDIDYILDERIRELIWEEPRRITLGRLGLIYDRTSRYNDYAKDFVQPHHNLYPIPQTDVLVNSEAELAQNPGYD